MTLAELTKDWVLEVNTSVGTGFNTLKIALASNGPALAGDGVLVSLSFDTAGHRKVTTAPLYLTHALLNDGALKGLQEGRKAAVDGHHRHHGSRARPCCFRGVRLR